MGPGTYENQYSGKPLYKFKPSSAFSSNLKRDTKIVKATEDMDQESARKIEGLPGPGHYKYDINILAKGKQTHNVMLNGTCEKKPHSSYTNIDRVWSGTDRQLSKDDRDAFYQQYTNLPGGNRGPGCYETQRDFNKRSYRRNWNNLGFGQISKRLDNFIKPDAGMGERAKSAVLDGLLNKATKNKAKEHMLEEKNYNKKNENTTAFNAKVEQRPPNPLDLRGVPDPGTYIEIPSVDKEDIHHFAFTNTTDRGLVVAEAKKNPLNHFMLDIMDRDKINLKKKLIASKNFKNLIPEKKKKALVPNIDYGTKLKHCLLTTVPRNKLPRNFSEAGGNLHTVHYHDDGDTKDRIVFRRPHSVAPFSARTDRWPEQKIRAPGPGHYTDHDKVDWTKKTYNVTYMENFEAI